MPCLPFPDFKSNSKNEKQGGLPSRMKKKRAGNKSFLTRFFHAAGVDAIEIRNSAFSDCPPKRGAETMLKPPDKSTAFCCRLSCCGEYLILAAQCLAPLQYGNQHFILIAPRGASVSPYPPPGEPADVLSQTRRSGEPCPSPAQIPDYAKHWTVQSPYAPVFASPSLC